MKHITIKKSDFNKTLKKILEENNKTLLALVYDVQEEDNYNDVFEIKFVIQKCAGLLDYSLRVFVNEKEEFAARNLEINSNTTIKNVLDFLEE